LEEINIPSFSATREFSPHFHPPVGVSKRTGRLPSCLKERGAKVL
jgi:hypothetical protein